MLNTHRSFGIIADNAVACVFVLAVLTLPFQVRLAIGPVHIWLCEAVVLLGAVLCIVSRQRLWTFAGATNILPFLAVCGFSCLFAFQFKVAVKECAQIIVVCIAGIVGFECIFRSRVWRHGLAVALLFAVIGSMFTASAELLGANTHISGPSLGAMSQAATAALAGTILCCQVGVRRWVTWSLVLVLFLIVVGGTAYHALYTRQQLDNIAIVPERYREALAAMNVLSEYPVFGVGLGNYQLKIGEFYRGLPKENTIVQGSQVGWCLVLASIGLVGCAALVSWLRSMFAAGTSRVAPAVVTAAIGMLITPPFVTPILLLLSLCHVLSYFSDAERT